MSTPQVVTTRRQLPGSGLPGLLVLLAAVAALCPPPGHAAISRIPIDRKFPTGFCPWETVVPFSTAADSVTIRFSALRADSLGIDNIFVVRTDAYVAHKGSCPRCPNFDLDGKQVPVEGLFFDQVSAADIARGETFDTNPSARGWDMTQGAVFDASLSAPKLPASSTSTTGPGFLRLTGTTTCSSDSVHTSVRVGVTPNQGYVLTGWMWSNGLASLLVTIDTDPQVLDLGTSRWGIEPGLGGVHTMFFNLGPFAACADGKGGLYAAAEYNRDANAGDDVYITHLDQDGVPDLDYTLASGTTAERRVAMDADPDGAGAVVAWEDFRAGNPDIYTQHARGSFAIWTSGGRAVATGAAVQEWPRCATEGANGAILAWDDLRSGLRQLYAQKVPGSGTPAWTSNGVLVCGQAVEANEHELISDGSGGAFLAWTDLRRGRELYVQRLDATGARLWGANGAPACSLITDASHPVLCPDGTGGFVVGWVDIRSGAPTSNLYAQRFNSAGQPQWTVHGVPITTAAGAQSELRSLLLPDGRYLFAWTDARGGAETDIYAQVLDPSGNRTWPAGDVAVCQAVGVQSSPTIATDVEGSIYVAWIDGRLGSGSGIPYAQGLTPGGAVRWAPDGVNLVLAVPTSFRAPKLFRHPESGVLAVVGRDMVGAVVSMRIDRNGLLGSSEPLILGIADHPGDQGHALDLYFAPSARDKASSPQIGSYQVQYGSNTTAWTTTAVIPARQACSYPATIFCPVDSVVGIATQPVDFRVVATRTSDGATFESRPVAAFAIDNIPPSIPDGFTWQYAGPPDGQGNRPVRLDWGWSAPVGAPGDLASARLYRSPDVFLTPPAASFFAEAPGGPIGWFIDSGATVANPYYFIRVVDLHGNMSPALSATEGTSVSVGDPSIPVALAIGHPRPNPTAGGGELDLALPVATAVRVDCYDVTGRLRRQAGPTVLPAGHHHWTLAASDRNGVALPAGLYFLRVTVGTTVETRRWVRL